MRRLFRKGEHVRSKANGRMMEVLKYLKENLLEVKLYDADKREVYFDTVSEDHLLKE